MLVVEAPITRGTTGRVRACYPLQLNRSVGAPLSRKLTGGCRDNIHDHRNLRFSWLALVAGNQRLQRVPVISAPRARGQHGASLSSVTATGELVRALPTRDDDLVTSSAWFRLFLQLAVVLGSVDERCQSHRVERINQLLALTRATVGATTAAVICQIRMQRQSETSIIRLLTLMFVYCSKNCPVAQKKTYRRSDGCCTRSLGA